jgi:hypothetical protein
MPDLTDVLNAEHSEYTRHAAHWARLERLMEGGLAVLGAAPGATAAALTSPLTARLAGGSTLRRTSELMQWDHEDAAHYEQRLGEAFYHNLPKLHASTLVGHMARQRPEPNWGLLGEVRAREEITRDRPADLAEMLHYNVDGAGVGGAMWPDFTDLVQERAINVGHQWVMVESRDLASVRARARRLGRATPPDGAPPSMLDVLNGWRVYAVPHSPLLWPYWEMEDGQLAWAVGRLPVPRSLRSDRLWTPDAAEPGFYLLVQEGYDGLGDEYAQGGWWLFDADEQRITDGRWVETRGMIPMFPWLGERSHGTVEFPSMSRSLNADLGNLAVSMMNRRSEWEYDLADAFRSVKFILGGDESSHNEVQAQWAGGGIIITVKPTILRPGTVDERALVPALVDSSGSAVSPEAYRAFLELSLSAARDVMVRQMSSTPDSSGRSKEAGFAEATSPLLSRLAATRENAENTLLTFLELRSGVVPAGAEPTAYVQWPREFDIAPAVDELDAALASIVRAEFDSITLKSRMIRAALEERGTTFTDAEWAKIEAEAGKAREQRTPLFGGLEMPPPRAGNGNGATPEEDEAEEDDEAPAGARG